VNPRGVLGTLPGMQLEDLAAPLLLGFWILLQWVILPRLGVPT
jgi:hypothetical protein